MWWLCLSAALAVQQSFSVQDLFERSHLVVEAEVSSSEARFVQGAEGRIETQVWLTPLTAVSGNVPSDLTMTLDQGDIDGLWTRTEHEPMLAEDHRYLLFLIPDEEGGWDVLGGERGAWELRSVASPNAPSLTDVLGALHDR